MKLVRGLVPLALVAPLLWMPAAHATVSDVATIHGDGNVTPGIPCAPCNITFVFSATLTGDEVTNLTNCVFNGVSASESISAGSGSGDLSGCGITGHVDYTRTGLAVTLSGSVTINGIVHTVGPSALTFVLKSVLPTTSFSVAGTVELDD